ncbi:IS1 family transposase [Acidocella sp.]|jgi:IS1 family transposase|uniref:IS1 family transposase n=1 Tax=Acidocella sp. TaxID=50710 RepID=UPI002F4092A9
MNKLTSADRAKILHLLCEGSSIRAIERITGVNKITITKLLVDAGKVCMDYHDANVRDVQSKRVQCDEIWSFCYAKKRNVEAAKAAPEGAGDVWTWTALDADSKLVISYLVANRDAPSAYAFMADLAGRLASQVQLTTDNLRSYLDAVEDAFGGDIDYAILTKLYGDAPEPKGRYSPAYCTGTRKARMMGAPDMAHVSTSYVEKNNLTMRMHMRRFTRLTNAFSKKFENHAYAVALHMMYYNYVKIHGKLRTSPAMAAGIETRLWEISDIVALLEACETATASKVRGPYKKKVAEFSN